MKKISFFPSAVVLVSAVTAVIYLIPNPYSEGKFDSVNLSLEKESPKTKNEGYFTTAERTVNGSSLSGVIENAQTVRILFGYYDHRKAEREDIVAYRYAGNKNPIIKIVKARAGDRFSLKKAEAPSGWNIFVNDKIVTNSQNLPYLLNKEQYRMLSLYERDYHGIIPKDSYLILGNRPSGTVDSSRFGLVHKSDILGKVEIN